MYHLHLMKKDFKILCAIPARSGSIRVPDKNIRNLKGHPLIAYSIQLARSAKFFDKILVSTDSTKYADIAKYYGAEVPFMRDEDKAQSDSPDIQWVLDTLEKLKKMGEEFDILCILRPTSPFRTIKMLEMAINKLISIPGIDSIRGVELVNQHPGKMWVVHEDIMYPFLPLGTIGQPWHSSQSNTLPPVYVQNASLEMVWVGKVLETETIAGTSIAPLTTERYEGFDINTEYDWHLANYLIDNGEVDILHIEQESYLLNHG